jgi:hypothetical protein
VSIHHVDGTRDLPDAARERLGELYALGEAPSNELLRITARDTTASQDLLADPVTRHRLLGAGWTDAPAPPK